MSKTMKTHKLLLIQGPRVSDSVIIHQKPDNCSLFRQPPPALHFTGFEIQQPTCTRFIRTSVHHIQYVGISGLAEISSILFYSVDSICIVNTALQSNITKFDKC